MDNESPATAAATTVTGLRLGAFPFEKVGWTDYVGIVPSGTACGVAKDIIGNNLRIDVTRP